MVIIYLYIYTQKIYYVISNFKANLTPHQIPSKHSHALKIVFIKLNINYYIYSIMMLINVDPNIEF